MTFLYCCEVYGGSWHEALLGGASYLPKMEGFQYVSGWRIDPAGYERMD